MPVRKRLGRLGLHARLTLLVALCVLPLVAYMLGSDVVAYHRARAAMEAQMRAEAHGFAEDVGRLLQTEMVELRTLALAHPAHAGFGDFPAQATAFLALHRVPAALRVDGPDGVPLLAAGPPTHTLRAEVLRLVFGQDRPVIVGYHANAVGEAPGICINVPIEEDGRPRWDLRLELGVAIFGPVVAAQAVPRDWGLVIADGDDRTVVHEPPDPPYPGEIVPADLHDALHRMADGVLSRRTGDGRPMRVVFATVPGTVSADAPWHVVIGVPESTQLAPLRRRTVLSLLAGVALLVTGLVLAHIVSHGITRPIARLQALAAAPDARGPPPPTGLPETDAVAQALHEAALARHEALARLQALTATLESRVAQEVAARHAAQERAAQGERLQALGRLAGGIAHDFNNVLQTMNTAADVLAHARDEATVRRMSRLLGHAAQQGAAITGRLLGFARRNAPLRLVPLDLPPLLADLREMLSATLGNRVAVSLAVAEGLPPVLADHGQLETVLINLAANARDAMPHGGQVRLSAAPAAEEASRPANLPPGRYVTIAVTDNGTGMTPAVLARVTEPFFTTKPEGRGTGLGLSLARGFAEHSGGALVIDSAEGQGTTVTLWLREASAAAAAA